MNHFGIQGVKFLVRIYLIRLKQLKIDFLCIKGEVLREYFMNHFGIQGFNDLVRIYLNLPKQLKNDFKTSDKKCSD